MKSLPEEELMNVLRKRLAEYTEEPDEDAWQGIVASLPKQPVRWVKPTVLALLFIIYGAFMWTAGRFYGKETIINSQYEKNRFAAGLQSTLNEGVCEVACEQGSVNAKIRKSSAIASGTLQEKEKLSTTLIFDNEKKNSSDVSDQSISDRLVKNESFIDSKANNDSVDGPPARNDLPLFEMKDTFRLPLDSLDSKKMDTLRRKEKQNKKRNKKASWYAMLTPSLAYQKVIPFKSDEVLITNLNSKGIFSGDRIGISADLGYQLDVSNRIIVYSGLSYYQQNSTLTYSYQSENVTEITSSSDPFSYVLSPGSSSQIINYKMRNVGLSIGMLYRLQGKKLRHSIGLGAQYQFGLLSRHGNDSYINKGSSYLNYQFLYRIEWVMNSRYHWFIQPNYSRLLLSNEYLHLPLKIEPYKAGIGVGVTYYLN